MNSIEALHEIFSTVATDLVVAVIILLSGFILGRITGKVAKRILHEIELNKTLKQIVNRSIPAEEIISWLVANFIYLVSFIFALDQIGLNTLVLNVLAIAILIVIFLSIILAIRETVPNAFAGIILQMGGSIKVGDKIKVEDTSGRVIGMDLIETRIETENGDIILIPNSILTKRVVYKRKKLDSL